MFLDATTRSLRMYTNAAATTTEPCFYASYVKIADTMFLPTAVHGLLTGTTPKEVVPAPATDIPHQIKQLTVQNQDTVSHTLFVELLDNGTQRLIYKMTVAAGQAAFWTHENGWQVY